MIGRNDFSDYAGIAFPYIWPGGQTVREYRLRLDHPQFEVGGDGRLRPRQKYLGPPGRPNLLYLPPDIDPVRLSTVDVPIVITEGEKKTLALHCLGEMGRRWLAIGIAGVWG